MKTLIFLLLSIPISTFGSTYTEFYINNAGGGNTNSGHTADASPTFAAVNGFWTNYTGYGVFYKSGMTLTGVTNGAWASVYTNTASTATAFVGIITNVDDAGDFIFVKTVEAKSGTAIADDNVGVTCIVVGGAWLGPGTYDWATGTGVASNTFPFALLANTMTNGYPPCFNVKSGTTYSITNALTVANAGPFRIQGYTTDIRDGGKPTIQGWASGVSFVLFTVSGANVDLQDIIFSRNGNSGSAAGVSISGGEINVVRCVVTAAYRSGFSITGNGGNLIECEAYGNNVANSAGHAGFNSGVSGTFFERCISHDNSGANSDGFLISATATLLNCIADSNGKNGFTFSGTTVHNLLGSDAYNNTGSGVDLSTASGTYIMIENCNLVLNGAYGINSSGSTIRNGRIVNCGFGTGTKTNATGSFGPNLTGSQSSVEIAGTLLYSADQTPWVDPDNGDFRINLAAAKAAGRGSFTETAGSYSGTIAYPDIGAAQTASTNAATAGGAYTFAQ